MPETDKAHDDKDRTNNKKKGRSTWLWFALYGVLVLTGLSIGSCYFKTGADRARFWVEGILSAGVLTVVIVQTYIYRKQWEEMAAQRKAMTDQLDAINKQAQAAELSARITSESFKPQIHFVKAQLTPLRATEEPTAIFILGNSGSVAKKAELTFNWTIRPWADSSVLPWTDYTANDVAESSEPITLGNGEHNTLKTIIPAPIDEVTLKRIANGDDMFTIYGAISYEDALGRPYSIPFCRYYNRADPSNLAFCPRRIRTKHQEEQGTASQAATNTLDP